MIISKRKKTQWYTSLFLRNVSWPMNLMKSKSCQLKIFLFDGWFCSIIKSIELIQTFNYTFVFLFSRRKKWTIFFCCWLDRSNFRFIWQLRASIISHANMFMINCDRLMRFSFLTCWIRHQSHFFLPFILSS